MKTTTFSVRVPNTRQSVKVVVYERVQDFKQRAGMRSRRVLAFCVSTDARRCVAEIHIPRRYLSIGTITHEAFHATCRYMERRGGLAIPITGNVTNMDPGEPESPEEHAAKVLDGLCTRISLQLYRRKLYPENAA